MAERRGRLRKSSPPRRRWGQMAPHIIQSTSRRSSRRFQPVRRKCSSGGHRTAGTPARTSRKTSQSGRPLIRGHQPHRHSNPYKAPQRPPPQPPRPPLRLSPRTLQASPGRFFLRAGHRTPARQLRCRPATSQPSRQLMAALHSAASRPARRTRSPLRQRATFRLCVLASRHARVVLAFQRLPSGQVTATATAW